MGTAVSLEPEDTMAREPATRDPRVSVPAYADPFTSLRSEMNRLFDNFFEPVPRSMPALWGDTGRTGEIMPQMDVKETDTAITVEAELPGLDEKNVNVTLADGILTIKGEKSEDKKEEREDYHVTERRYGSFQRSLRLPEAIDDAKVEAHFDKGVLRVVVPKKADAQPRERRIEIKRT
jgi:HSP20 family protein